MFNLKNTSPYANIKKEQLVYGDTMQSKAFGVKIETSLGSKPWEEIAYVSSDYLLVPNKTMVQKLEMYR
jgi:hypothetical protein